MRMLCWVLLKDNEIWHLIAISLFMGSRMSAGEWSCSLFTNVDNKVLTQAEMAWKRWRMGPGLAITRTPVAPVTMRCSPPTSRWRILWLCCIWSCYPCQDVDTGDRTFNSILSLLVGRQSVSQTLRLLRQEVRLQGDTESSSGNVSSLGSSLCIIHWALGVAISVRLSVPVISCFKLSILKVLTSLRSLRSLRVNLVIQSDPKILRLVY